TWALRQRCRHQERDGAQRGAPGAKILGGKIRAHGVAQIRVHLIGIDWMAAAIFVHVLKEALPGQLMAAPHQLDQALIVECNLVIGATLAAESEKQPAVAYELYVTVLQCREAVAVVVARILVVADSKPGRVEQADDDGEHFFSRQAGQREIVAES